ncbi:MAG: phospholipid transport system substrate-binding protein [Gammaproteobacteria bacterium]|jgi:phospholipid transport system substrate-binding protein
MRCQLLRCGVGNARTVACVLSMVSALFLLSDVALANEALSRPVLGFQQTLIAAMKDGADLGFAGRKSRMQSLVDEHFDMPAITRAVIGRHYQQMEPAQRAALSKRIHEFAISTLASRFSRFDNERFLDPVVRVVNNDRARLSSKFVQVDGDATDLTYDLSRVDERWRISNISFGGVSGTSIQRAEFEVFLRSGGSASLLEKLDTLISEIERDAK